MGNTSASSTARAARAIAGASGCRERSRATEQVALAIVDAAVAEEGERLGVLDALGDRLRAKLARHRHDGADDRPVLRAVTGVAHEARVDLQVVDGQPTQVGDRAEPSAEVVEREAAAELPETIGEGA